MERMTYVEFQHWKAKFQRHPFGQVQEDYRFGVLTTLLNGLLQSWSKKRLRLPRMEKYFPSLKEMMEQGWKQTPEEMAGILRALCKSHGGRIIKADGTIEDCSSGGYRKSSSENFRRPNRGRP